MKKSNIFLVIIFLLAIVISTFIIVFKYNSKIKQNINKGEQSTKIPEVKNKVLNVSVISKNETQIIAQDNKNIIYALEIIDDKINIGDNVCIEYEGTLDKNKTLQNILVLKYEINKNSKNNVLERINELLQDNSIFEEFYEKAYKKVKDMTLQEKIGQILLVRYPDKNQIEDLQNYKFGGYLFFEKDFKNKSKEEVINMINKVQNVSNIPLLIAVDEEGGKVVRVSSNPNLSSMRFKSASELYNLGGFEMIKEDTVQKSKVLSDLGINLNLAPVVDVSTNPEDYIYARTLGKEAIEVATYAKTVIKASKNTNVSYTLKHFPGYGNNLDTHTGESVDNRTYEDILNNDILPFKEAVKVGAEAVIVSHNIVTSIDDKEPASLSTNIHNFLRNEVDFSGIVITDDLDMKAVSNKEGLDIKAVLSGNDLIITTDYVSCINNIKKAVEDKVISEKYIEKLAVRVIAWKYYKGLLT